MPKIRLIKIASEINIGKETIVDFLHSKGFDIENKPTASLDEEMQNLVYEKFKREKKNAETQREKLLKQKEKIASAPTVVSIEQTDEPSNIQEKESNKTIEKVSRAEEKTLKTPEKSSVEPVQEAFDFQGESPKEKDALGASSIKTNSEDINKNFVEPDNLTTNTIELPELEKQVTTNNNNNNSSNNNNNSPVFTEEEKNKNVSSTPVGNQALEKKPSKEEKTDEQKMFDKRSKRTERFDSTIQRGKTKNEGGEKSKHSKRSIQRPHSTHLTSRLGDMLTTPIIIKTSPELAAKIKTKEEKKYEKERLSSLKTKSKEVVDIKTSDSNINRDLPDVTSTITPNVIKDASSDDYNTITNISSVADDLDNVSIFTDENSTGADKNFGHDEEKSDSDNKVLDNELADEGQPTEESDKRRKKKHIDDRVIGEKIELKGLTVLGKIELAKPAPPAERPSRRDERRRKEDYDKHRREKEPRSAGWQPYSFDRDTKVSGTEKPVNKRGDFRDKNKEATKEKIQIQSGARRLVSRDGASKNKPTTENKNKSTGTQQNAKFGDFIKPANAGTTVQRIFSNAPAQPAATKSKVSEKRRKKSMRDTISDEDVNRKIRETLSGMDDNYSSAKKSKIKQQKKASREEKEAIRQEIIERESHILNLTEFVTTNDLAKLMNIQPNEIILKCMQLGLMVTINQRLDKDTLMLIASDYGFEVEFAEADEMVEIEEIEDSPKDLLPRPPIVTIMGHVDHGKTSLLDHIRNSNVIAGEAGGITQHIGAYRVTLKNGKHITFLDTPGHEAFTAMRARGVQVTDIVVLVVAADDSVMPQTIEAISHARAANVPIIVAINKIDKPEANPDRIKQQLADQGILVEDWGGKYQCAEISAKKGLNVDALLDKILLEAEILDLKANPNRNAYGVVIESNMTKGWGNVATIVVQNGTLFLGESFVAGASYGKTRALLDERAKKVQDVLPSQPVVVVGFDGLPEAGDTFHVIDSESRAKEIASTRRSLRREQDMRKVRHITLDDISAQISIGGVKDLTLLIKGDVAGSVEALSDSLLKLSTEEVRVRILHKCAGAVTESDVMLAAASNAIIIAFNTSSTVQAARLAEVEQVELRSYNIIYDCINEIQLALEGMLKPDIKEEIVATVEVRKIFKVGRTTQIAGCYVLSGKISRNDKVRVLRNGLPIHSSTLSSLKRNKDDAKEVEQNYECGIQLDSWNSFEEGDIIEAYKLIEVKRVLSSSN